MRIVAFHKRLSKIIIVRSESMKQDMRNWRSRFDESKENFCFTFLVTFLIGILAHGFMFANDFANRDNIRSFWQVNSTWTSGRWLLGILQKVITFLFGSVVSLPWLIGCLACMWLALAACLLVEAFKVKSRVYQTLIGAFLITFPSVISTFTYMFTSVLTH